MPQGLARTMGSYVRCLKASFFNTRISKQLQNEIYCATSVKDCPGPPGAKYPEIGRAKRSMEAPFLLFRGKASRHRAGLGMASPLQVL